MDSRYAIYCRCGGMPNEGREEQPYATRELAEAALARGREAFADSGSIARTQWNEAEVHPYTGPRRVLAPLLEGSEPLPYE